MNFKILTFEAFPSVATSIRIFILIQFISSILIPSSGTPDSNTVSLVILIVSFDGFRNSYLHQNLTPVLTNLSSTGATVPYLIPAFPTKTFPNHQSIATGLYTESHGIIDNSFYDSFYNATLEGKKNSPGFWNYDENVLPLWIRNEQQGGTSGCLMWPGSSHGYGKNSELLPTYYFPGYDPTLSWESRVETVISWMTDSNRPANLIYLYYPEPDVAGHRYGPNGEETLDQVAETDKRVEFLVQELKIAGIYEKTNLVVLSDHGMEEITADREIDLDKFLDKDNLVSGIKGGSTVIQIMPKPGKADKLYKSLKKISKKRNFTVFKKSELCGEPYFYCLSNRRIHDFVVLANPGWVFLDNSRNTTENERKVYGSHGYSNREESMRGFFIANGPNFKSEYVTEKPIKNVDIVPLLSKLLGLEDVPSNGSLMRIEGILKG